MKKVLIKLKIVQVVSNDNRNKLGLKRLGKGYKKAYRLNPYNPLSYLIVIVSIPVILLLRGILGLFYNMTNPFAWD